MTSVNEATITTTLYDALVAAFPDVKIGDGERPTGADEVEGYAVLYPIPSGDRNEGPWYAAAPSAITWMRFQVVAAGVQRDQVQTLSNDLAAKIVERAAGDWALTLAPAGHKVMNRVRRGSIPLDRLGTWQAGQLVDLHITIT